MDRWCIIAICAVLGGCSEQSRQPASHAFNVPAAYLGCMEIDVAPGESFGNFDIYQPVHFTVQHDARVHDVFVEQSCAFKEAVLFLSAREAAE